MRAQTILFGNGINRANQENYPDWDCLLENLSNELFTHIDIDRATGAFAALQFDCLMCSGPKGLTAEQTEKSLLDTLKPLDSIGGSNDSLFSGLLDCGACNYLTTNYDYALERTLAFREGLTLDKFRNSKGLRITLWQESYTTVKRCWYTQNGTNIYHIHGELERYKTVCLGHVHYVRNLQAIMNYLIDKNVKAGAEYRFRPDLYEGENGQPLGGWPARFFTDDLYIIGLGLSPSEIDLWWLLSYRAALISENDINAPNNTIKYLVAYENIEPEVCRLLRSLNVEILSQVVRGNDWKSAQRRLISYIKDDIALKHASDNKSR